MPLSALFIVSAHVLASTPISFPAADNMMKLRGGISHTTAACGVVGGCVSLAGVASIVGPSMRSQCAAFGGFSLPEVHIPTGKRLLLRLGWSLSKLAVYAKAFQYLKLLAPRPLGAWNLIPLLSVSSGAPAQTVLSGLYACAAFSGLSEKIEPVLRQRALIKQRKLQHQQQGPPRVPPPRHMQYQSLNERRVHYA